MSAHGQKFHVTAPLLGVRKDVDKIAQTDQMMPTGENVVTTGGSVRPRCCHTREGFGQIATDWKVKSSVARLVAVWDGWMVAWDPVGGWIYSTDAAENWSPLTLAGSLVGSGEPSAMFAFGVDKANPKLWIWEKWGNIHYVDMKSFSGTLTGVALGRPLRLLPKKAYLQAPKQYNGDLVCYDQESDALWWHAFGDGKNPVSQVPQASTVVNSATFEALYQNSSGVNIYSGIEPDAFMNWTSANYKLIGCGQSHNSLAGVLNSTAVLQSRSDPLSITIIDHVPLNDPYVAYNPSYTFTTDVPAQEARVYDNPTETDGFCEMLLGDRIATRDLTTELTTNKTDVYSINSFKRYARDFIETDNYGIVGDVHIVSDDDGVSWDPVEAPPVDQDSIIELYTARVSGNSYYFLHEGNNLWASPINDFLGGSASDTGDVTGIFQCSLDLEDFAFFTGSTEQIRKLDRLTEEWEDITNSAHAPNGVLGINPWVFRSFEKGGNRFMVAVNGEATPQCFESGYSKMRAIGDTNFDDAWTGDEEEPPTGHCLAVSNNRLVMGVRPHNLYFSRPNNMDIGYNDFEVRLNDTEGELVCMYEIGASQLVAFKTDAIYHGQSQVAFMGTSAPMNFKRVRKGIVGPCSPQSVSYLPDGRLIYLGRDGGVYIYDAVAPLDAGRHIRAIIRDQIDPDRYGQAWSMVDTKRALAYFFYPTRDGLMNRAVVMAMDMGQPWPAWEFTLPSSWHVVAGMNAYFKSSSMLGSFPGMRLSDFPDRTLGSFTYGGKYGMVIVRRDGTWYRQEWDLPPGGDYTDAGLPIPWSWGNGWFNYDGDNSSREVLHELHHVAELNGNSMEVKLYSEQFDGTTKVHEDVLSPGMPRLKTTCRHSGRRHRLEFSGSCDDIFYWAQATAVPIGRGNR